MSYFILLKNVNTTYYLVYLLRFYCILVNKICVCYYEIVAIVHFFVAPNSYWIYNHFWQLLVSHHDHQEHYNDYNYWCDVWNHNFQLHTVFHNYHIDVLWVIAQILCICFVRLFVGFLSWLYFQIIFPSTMIVILIELSFLLLDCQLLLC